MGTGSPSREHLAVSGDIFGCINWGDGQGEAANWLLEG